MAEDKPSESKEEAPASPAATARPADGAFERPATEQPPAVGKAEKQDAAQPAAPGGEDAGARVVRNEDGSITVAASEELPKKQVQRWTGRGVRPDVRYQSVLMTKFINCVMRDGKKSVAERIVYRALEQIADKLRVDPLNVFEQAIDNARPKVEVRSKRIGGANYQVPVEVKPHRAQTLAIRWILEAARARSGRPMVDRLSQELIDCYNKTGSTIQRRENTHRMAEANKAFSHFS